MLVPNTDELHKRMGDKINEYYTNSSILRPNKFVVSLYGEYVDQALEKMDLDLKQQRSPSNQYNGVIKQHENTNAFEHWKKIYVSDVSGGKNKQVNLKWTCSDVKLPSVQAETATQDFWLDSIKSIKHPIIMGATSDQTLSMGIVEDRHLMMYQFFNALLNRFFSPQILKARSSFQKLNIMVGLLQEDNISESGTYKQEIADEFSVPMGDTDDGFNATRNKTISTRPMQVFEYNSIVLTGIPDLILNNNIKDVMKYNISFKVPNAFQGSFKEHPKGLRDNTSTEEFLIQHSTIQEQAKYGTSSYNRNEFEVDETKLRVTQNGVYEQSTEPE